MAATATACPRTLFARPTPMRRLCTQPPWNTKAMLVQAIQQHVDQCLHSWGMRRTSDVEIERKCVRNQGRQPLAGGNTFAVKDTKWASPSNCQWLDATRSWSRYVLTSVVLPLPRSTSDWSVWSASCSQESNFLHRSVVFLLWPLRGWSLISRRWEKWFLAVAVTQKTAGFLPSFPLTKRNGFHAPFPKYNIFVLFSLSCGYSGFQNCLLRISDVVPNLPSNFWAVFLVDTS